MTTYVSDKRWFLRFFLMGRDNARRAIYPAARVVMNASLLIYMRVVRRTMRELGAARVIISHIFIRAALCTV